MYSKQYVCTSMSSGLKQTNRHPVAEILATLKQVIFGTVRNTNNIIANTKTDEGKITCLDARHKGDRLACLLRLRYWEEPSHTQPAVGHQPASYSTTNNQTPVPLITQPDGNEESEEQLVRVRTLNNDALCERGSCQCNPRTTCMPSSLSTIALLRYMYVCVQPPRKSVQPSLCAQSLRHI